MSVFPKKTLNIYSNNNQITGLKMNFKVQKKQVRFYSNFIN